MPIREQGSAMNSHCLPFRQIPHTTQLFLDYLEFTPSVQQFYPRSPRFVEWAKDESARIEYPGDRRARVADILDRQNKWWGASSATLENVQRCRSGACALVTDFGVILLDGSDPELDQIAAPLYRAAITRAPELAAALMKRDQQLRAAEYHQQVRITDSSTLLFVIRDGSRVPVHFEAGKFLI